MWRFEHTDHCCSRIRRFPRCLPWSTGVWAVSIRLGPCWVGRRWAQRATPCHCHQFHCTTTITAEMARMHSVLKERYFLEIVYFSTLFSPVYLVWWPPCKYRLIGLFRLLRRPNLLRPSDLAFRSEVLYFASNGDHLKISFFLSCFKKFHSLVVWTWRRLHPPISTFSFVYGALSTAVCYDYLQTWMVHRV